MTNNQIREKIIRARPKTVKPIFQDFDFNITFRTSSPFHSEPSLKPPFS
jgi:hypothetical protein